MSVGSLFSQGIPPQAPDGISAWDVFLIVAAVLGVIAATQQLVSWLTGRRRQRALERFGDAIANEIDADATEQELERLRQLKENIQEQIQSELPREARRVYLENRFQTISTSIGDLFAEYKLIEAELKQDPVRSPLEESLRDAIEETIMPAYHQRERRQRQLRILLLVALVLLITPIPLGYLALELIGNYFNVVMAADEYSNLAVLSIVLQASLVVAAVMTTAILVGRRKVEFLSIGEVFVRHRTRLILASIALIALSAACLWVTFRFQGYADEAYKAYSAENTFTSEGPNYRQFVRARDISATLSISATVLMSIGISVIVLSTLPRISYPWFSKMLKGLRGSRR